MSVQPERFYPAWTFGDRLRKARTITGMTQEDFAAAIGVKEGSLAAWETDRAQPRNIVAIAKRIEVLTGIPAVWTLELDDGERPAPPDPDGGVETQLPGDQSGSPTTGLGIISAKDAA